MRVSPSVPEISKRRETRRRAQNKLKPVVRIRKWADRALTILIDQTHIDHGVCQDPRDCVVGLALQGSVLGEFFEGFHVGTKITKIITSDKIVSYRTPERLAEAVRKFDAKEGWDLEPGYYTLLPIPPSMRVKSRLHLIRGDRGGKINRPKRVVRVPSRKTMRVTSPRLAAVSMGLSGGSQAGK